MATAGARHRGLALACSALVHALLGVAVLSAIEAPTGRLGIIELLAEEGADRAVADRPDSEPRRAPFAEPESPAAEPQVRTVAARPARETGARSAPSATASPSPGEPVATDSAPSRDAVVSTSSDAEVTAGTAPTSGPRPLEPLAAPGGPVAMSGARELMPVPPLEARPALAAPALWAEAARVSGERAQPGSPLGLRGRVPLRVQLDAPPARVTDQPSLALSGRITGDDVPDRLFLRINDATREVATAGRVFHSTVALVPGVNRIRAAVVGPDGVERDDTLVVEYAARASAVALVAPRDGLTLGPDDSPVLAIEGTLEDASARTIWLVVNGDALAVPVREQRFRQLVPVLEPVSRVWAESRSSAGEVQRSQVVTVSRSGAPAPTALLIVTWPEGGGGMSPEVSATVRTEPGRLDAAIAPVRLTRIAQTSEPGSSAAYAVQNPRPGVYSFTARWPSPATQTELRSTLYVADNGRVSRRPLKQPAARPEGRALLARVLLPQGVQWDDDGWFTGKTESVEAITRFRFPDGIAWTERKADLQ